MKQEKWEEALAYLRQAQEFDQEFIRKGHQGYLQIPFYLGQVLDNLGRRDEAIKEYQNSIKLDPLGDTALVNLGNIFRAMKTEKGYAKAEELYRQAINVKPACAEAWTNLGAVMNDTHRYAEAVKFFEEAARYNPTSAMTYYNLGIALSGLGRLAEAEKAYRKAIELDENFAEAHCNLGGVVSRQGKFKEALERYRRGHELGSKTPGWPYPSERWVKDHARLVELEGMLAAVQRGEPPPAKPSDYFGMTEFALVHKQLPATAARLYAQGLEQLPITGEFKAVQLYNGACAACRAATGKGHDSLKLETKEQARLRGQALQWLVAALAIEKERSEKASAAQRAVILKRIQDWLVDSDVASLRDPAALIEIPAEECEKCLSFWADVLAFQARLRPAP
jgi:Tfp pilus assembly protein PilF